MAPILRVARANSLRVIEDSCETMFVRYHGRPAGSWGDVSCFSTYTAHLLVTGVGGLATTNDPELAALMLSLANHGRDGIYISMDDDKGKRGKILREIVARRFSFIHVGYSYRATEMEAALGLGQLRIKEKIIKAHQENAAYLARGLTDLSEFLQLPKTRPRTEHAFMMYPIVVKEPVNRDNLVQFLEERKIETRPMLPLIDQPVYRQLFGELESKYPVARWINHNGFYIGCHKGLRKRDLDYVIEQFHAYFKKRRRRQPNRGRSKD